MVQYLYSTHSTKQNVESASCKSLCRTLASWPWHLLCRLYQDGCISGGRSERAERLYSSLPPSLHDRIAQICRSPVQ
ncbi:unnamed protein product [Chondrus crispus]|uniref:Uncharacterized protein n=1 Tax=Chondrus crispus TaxID=2769 RepID=S0F322_CHOCR|nr:unnamed protein product [Chondrus crispus]CDF77575.1 unnamed protein product [Chondrus crispus]|eukprot:XP_005718076.1 unnamed protein product [Chondrus crispus]